MKLIELDARDWRTVLDFYEALLVALGAPRWHGRNVNALIDSMIYGGINEVDPPYKILISETAKLPIDVNGEIAFAILAVGEAQGTDIVVEFQTIP